MPPAWREPLDAFSAWSLASGHSPGTVKVRRVYLTALAQIEPEPWAVTFDGLVRVVADSGSAPETRKSARSTLRAFYSWAVAAGRIDRSPAAALPAVRVPEGRPRPAPSDVVNAALSRATPDEVLMLDLAFLAGLRRAEVARVHTRDITDGRLRVVGKGGKVRVVPLHPRLLEQLDQRPDGWMFPSPRRPGEPVTAGHVGVHLARLLGEGWTAHTLRHAAATRWYRAQRDLFATQRLLGHSRPETTARYVEPDDAALLAAVLA